MLSLIKITGKKGNVNLSRDEFQLISGQHEASPIGINLRTVELRVLEELVGVGSRFA
jgi:hypothetical protein